MRISQGRKARATLVYKFKYLNRKFNFKVRRMELKINECWNHIRNELGSRGQNFITWSVYNPQKLPFTARADDNSIIVDSPSITSPRPIYYKEFECVFGFYEDYINRIFGIRPKMKRCGYNSSYIITLIHKFCTN